MKRAFSPEKQGALDFFLNCKPNPLNLLLNLERKGPGFPPLPSQGQACAGMTNKPNNICIGQEGSRQQFKEPLKGSGHGCGREAFLSGESAGSRGQSGASARVVEQGGNGLG